MWCKGAKSMQVDLKGAGSHRTMPGLMEQPSPSILGPRCRSCKTVPKMQTSYITTATSSYLQIGVVQARHRGGHCGSTWSSSSWRYVVQTNKMQTCYSTTATSSYLQIGVVQARHRGGHCGSAWSSSSWRYVVQTDKMQTCYSTAATSSYLQIGVVQARHCGGHCGQRGLLLPGAIWYRH